MAAAYFAPIDLVLSMNGLKLYINSNISKYFQIAILLIIISTNIIHLFATEYGNSITLKHVGDMLPAILSILIKVYLYRKRESILRLLLTMNQLLTDRQIQELRKFSIKCLIAFVVPSFSYLICCVTWALSFDNIQGILSNSVTDESDRSKSILAFIAIVGETLFTHTTIYLSGALYLVVLRTLSEINRSHYHSCLMSNQSDQIKHHIRNVQRLIGINDQFCRQFDLFPFLWCILLYVQSSGFIVRTVEWSSGSTNSESTLSIVTYLIETCITDTFYFSIVLFVAAKQQESIRKTMQTIQIQLWLKSIDNRSVIPLINAIDLVGFELSGLGLFVVDKRMFLPMFGSIITFSILFAQITGVNL